MGSGVLVKLLQPEVWEKYWKVSYEKCNLPETVDRQYSISICTTCMNRASDIKQTYIKNIEDNIKYSKVEFVLLNYNSKDDLDDYVKYNLMKYIDSGVLNYYRMLDDINVYSMTHSRNIAFKLAKGVIVNSLDGDHFTNGNFAERINQLANVFSEKIVFCKSKHKNRGRLGFYKKEFVDLLGGYDEDIEQYGADDKDLLFRAIHLGFKAVKFKAFCSITEDHKRHKNTNYTRNWKYSEQRNTILSLFNIMVGKLKANEGKHWGKAKLVKNFKEEVEI